MRSLIYATLQYVPDLGFELLVAVCPTFLPLLPPFLTGIVILIRFAVIVCMGQARGDGQHHASTSKEAWFEFSFTWTIHHYHV
jgi:hypothetical protein